MKLSKSVRFDNFIYFVIGSVLSYGLKEKIIKSVKNTIKIYRNHEMYCYTIQFMVEYITGRELSKSTPFDSPFHVFPLIRYSLKRR